ncbi:MAG: hypothetical protein A3K12_13495 [Candidatus Rokubacteria bacterium RIFCSPLOWO2_12_FULL_71_19]|nr:MAG: hypothetical protein A3K12_13495 [Candidatus Rokubacteria bacterium RIFCSPLOWO2_12_FULL_71_19]
METLCIIPARGGSKGLPKKNLVTIAGRSLFSLAAECVKNSQEIDRTVVSTDSGEIAAHARALGLEVPFLRPADLAMDDTPDWPVFHHCLQWLKDHEGYAPEIVVHLRVTSPWAFKRTRNGPGGLAANWTAVPRERVVDAAVAMLKANEDLDSVRSVELVRDTPYKMWRIEGHRLMPLLDVGVSEIYNVPRQKLPPVYLQNGYVDAARHHTVMEAKSMSGRTIGAYVVDCDHLVDIDGYADVDIGERLYQEIVKGSWLALDPTPGARPG